MRPKHHLKHPVAVSMVYGQWCMAPTSFELRCFQNHSSLTFDVPRLVACILHDQALKENPSATLTNDTGVYFLNYLAISPISHNALTNDCLGGKLRTLMESSHTEASPMPSLATPSHPTSSVGSILVCSANTQIHT